MGVYGRKNYVSLPISKNKKIVTTVQLNIVRFKRYKNRSILLRRVKVMVPLIIIRENLSIFRSDLNVEVLCCFLVFYIFI